MAKTRKTREQKIIADMRHQVYSLDNYSPAPSVKKSSPVIAPVSATISISFLKQDILKTSILTAAILLFQILLFIVLRTSILKIPGLSY